MEPPPPNAVPLLPPRPLEEPGQAPLMEDREAWTTKLLQLADPLPVPHPKTGQVPIQLWLPPPAPVLHPTLDSPTPLGVAWAGLVWSAWDQRYWGSRWWKDPHSQPHCCRC